MITIEQGAREGNDEPLFEARYDMTLGHVQATVMEYLDKGADVLPGGRFLGIVANPNEPMGNVGRWLETQIFNESFRHSPGEMSEAYADVEQDSRFLLVIDRHTYLPAGVMRIVDGESAHKLTVEEAPGLLAKVDHPEIENIDDIDPEIVAAKRRDIVDYHDIRPDEVAWDVATMAIPAQYRARYIKGVHVSGMLERMFVELGDQEGVERVYTLLDSKARRSLGGTGVPFKPLLGQETPFEYKNSPKTYAMAGDFKDFRSGVKAAHEAIRQESFIARIVRDGLHRAITRRAHGRVAGMAALGLYGVDSHIVMPAARAVS